MNKGHETEMEDFPRKKTYQILTGEKALNTFSDLSKLNQEQSRNIRRNVLKATAETKKYLFASKSKLTTNFWFMVLAPVITIFIFIVGYSIDVAISDSPEHVAKWSNIGSIWVDPLYPQARGGVKELIRILAAVFMALITVVGIIVQLSSNRFSPDVANLFLNDRFVQFMVGFYTTSLIYIGSVNFVISKVYIPRIAAVVAYLWVFMDTLLIFPFLNYVFDFLNPTKIVTKFGERATEGISPVSYTHLRAHETP
eukprot:TRINITY_DN7618_c0_g3_i1.p1 TRINITY_DN7618_c0_g3~~TRINITY_DN7618_c0_g3_i1.p1  ORF type:complete len:254 (-),score=31.82 TRINITY_DN7618_c0_g3_i1:15-776(-)